MTPAHEQRLATLLNPIVPIEFIYEFYGVFLLSLPRFLHAYHTWTQRRAMKRFIASDTMIHRHGFELYLRHRRLVPAKFIAARHGMTPESLYTWIDAMKNEDIHVRAHGNLIDEGLFRHLDDIIPSWNGLDLPDHEAFCERLHKSIEKEFKIDIDPVFCETATALKEKAYAYGIDSITGHPFGLKRSVWLNLNKPLCVGYEACSLLFYCKNKDVLKQYKFTGEDPLSSYDKKMIKKLTRSQ